MKGRTILSRLLQENTSATAQDDNTDSLDVAGPLAYQIAEDSAQLQIHQDQSDALHDILITLESIEILDAKHLMLVEAAMNMAYAGTPLRTKDLSPALESEQGMTITLEGIQERIAQLAAMIKRLLESLWARLSEFVSASVGEVARAKFRLDTLLTRCDEIEGRTPLQMQVNLGQAAYGLVTDKGLPQDAHGLMRHLDELRRQVQGVREHYVPTVLKIGDALAHQFPTWKNDPASAELWLHKLNQIASLYDIPSLASHIGNTSNVVDARYLHGIAIATPGLLGNRTLVFVDGKKVYSDKVNSDPLEQAVVLQGSSIDLTRLHVTKSIDPSKAVMKALTPYEIKDVLNSTAKILEQIEASLSDRLNLELSQRTKALSRAAEQVSGSVNDSFEYYRRGMAYCTAYATWAPRPFTPLIVHALSVVRATLSACTRHLDLY